MRGRPVLRVLAICSMFATVIAAGTFVARDPLGLFQSQERSETAASGNSGLSDDLTGAVSMGAEDPVKRFGQTQVGHIVFAVASSDTCRRALFDNHTGLTYDAPDVFCGSAPEQVIAAGNVGKLHSMSRSFKR
jgi:hypothetical protein